MKKLLCCFKGESSSNAEQDPRRRLANLQMPGPNPFVFPVTPALPADCGESFEWTELERGTMSFRGDFVLGRGAFGHVYFCQLLARDEDGAVKLQEANNALGHVEFVAEVTTLNAAAHPNVVRLLGKCYTPTNRAIVYEFMPNGSLERHLYARASTSAASTSASTSGSRSKGLGGLFLMPTRDLDWGTRMQIAVGVAEGLVYLHQELNVMHRDIKAANILLDKNFVAKLTDFGLATRIARDGNGIEQEIKIHPLKGTPGYMAPEAQMFEMVSTKTDVYSYGALLFVLFTGRKPYDSDDPVRGPKLTDWLNTPPDKMQFALGLLDAKLGQAFSVEGLNRIMQTVSSCINEKALQRPDMNAVLAMVREAAAFPVQQVPR